MLNTPIEYIILRTLPESFIAIFSVLFVLGISIKKDIFIKRGLLLGICVVIIRSLPIHYGIHTILSMIALAIVVFDLSDNDVAKTIIGTCVFFIALGLSEGIYIFITTKILNIPMEVLLNRDSWVGAVATLPSLLIALLIVVLIKYLIRNIIKKER